MDVVFMGTPEFAVPSLKALAAAHNVGAVYTRPDAISRRGNALLPPPVKVLADRLGLTVMQPSTLRDTGEAQRLRTLAPDVICVAAYGVILPPDILAIPSFGCINVHASLLPRHRGAAPIHRAVLEGDDTVGVSIMRMEEGLDTGPYAMQRSIPTLDRTVTELTDLLAEEGAQALLEILDEIATGTVSWIAQDDALATYAAKIGRQDVSLSPELTIVEALRRVRASTSQAPSRLLIDDVIVSVISASSVDDHAETGEVILGTDELVIGFVDGAMRLDMIRPAGKRDMSGSAWICGARIPAQCLWQAVA
ncbi:MAG: methionyl-tRNA formyltransferase [Coriobacteriia bacterium]|nr:methionyl-tRNA formyltransferase [Coriobacteriia bacterium]